LGDNRPISYDARYWREPYISENDLIGKVEFRFFPLNRIGKIE
jgi:signal peptidase I